MGPLTAEGFGIVALAVLCYGLYKIIRWAITGEVPEGVLEAVISPTLFFFTFFGGLASILAALTKLGANTPTDREELLLYTAAAIFCALLFSLQMLSRKRLTQIRKSRHHPNSWVSDMIRSDQGEWWQFWKG